MIRRRFKRVLWIVALIAGGLLYLLHAFMLFFAGIASVITSLLFFSTIAAVSTTACNIAARRLNLSRATQVNLWLVLGSVFLSVISADLYLRYGLARYATYFEKVGHFHSGPVYKKAWSQRLEEGRFKIGPRNVRFMWHQPEFSYEEFTNSEGLRDRDHAKAKPAAEFRIIGLGDSFTSGVGASFEATWLQQLRSTLRAGGDMKINVISGGVVGSDPFFEYMLLRHRLLDYGPDVVLVAINESDIGDYLVRGGMERFKDDGTIAYRQGPGWEWLYNSSYIFRHIAHDVFGYDHFLLRPQERAARTQQAFEDMYGVIQSFAELSQQRGFKLLIVFHPLAHEVLQRQSAFSDLLARLEKNPAIETLNLLEYYTNVVGMQQTNIADYYWPLDGHHTPKGYRVLAEGVAARLRQLGWLRGDEQNQTAPCRRSCAQ